MFQINDEIKAMSIGTASEGVQVERWEAEGEQIKIAPWFGIGIRLWCVFNGSVGGNKWITVRSIRRRIWMFWKKQEGAENIFSAQSLYTYLLYWLLIRYHPRTEPWEQYSVSGLPYWSFSLFWPHYANAQDAATISICTGCLFCFCVNASTVNFI